MGEPLTPDQNDWLDRIHKTATGTAAPVSLAFPPRNPADPFGLKMDPAVLQKTLEDGRIAEEKRQKEASAALEQARQWLCGMKLSVQVTLSYPEIITRIKEDYPAVLGLKDRKALMAMVDKALLDSGYMVSKGLLGDSSKLAMEKVIAAYIAALPSSIKAVVSGGGIVLTATGAGTGGVGAGTEAKGKAGKFEFKNKNYTIQISNAAWQGLDPALRAKWKSLNDEATALEKLQAALTSLKKEWETAGSDGQSSKIEVEARVKDLEAEFKGRWDTLRQTIDLTAKASTDGIKVALNEAKKGVADQKAGAELEVKFEEMSLGLKAFATTPDLKTALEVTGSAEKITAKIEAVALRTGTAVTLSYEKALKEVKEQLELQVKQGNTTLAATLSRQAVKLEEDLKNFNAAKTKDFQQVQALESGLEKLTLEVKAGFSAGDFKVTASGAVASGGEVGGKVKVELMLSNGIRFLGEGQKISFSADVSNKGYTFALMFSVGEMPEISDVHKAMAEADTKIKKLYERVQDTTIRGMDDATKIKDALSEALKPLKASVAAMKKADKRKFALEIGVTLGATVDDGGRMPPPMPGFNLVVKF